MAGGFSATRQRHIPVMLTSHSGDLTIGNGSPEQFRVATHAVVLRQAAEAGLQRLLTFVSARFPDVQFDNLPIPSHHFDLLIS